MSDLPETYEDPAVAIISTLTALPDLKFVVGVFGSNSWGNANKAIFIPFILNEPVTVTKMSWYVQSAAGNGDIGIYDLYGTRKVSSGSVATAGFAALQVVDVTDTPLAPGYYFLAASFDDNTFQPISNASGPSAFAPFGCCEMAAAFPLPATATLSRINTNMMVMIAAHIKATI